jgi:Protein of unknown function (DUF1329)
MLARFLLGLLALLAASTPRSMNAATVDGYEWPPDPKRYEPKGTQVAPGLAIGDTLSSANAAKAKDLLPPEVLSHFEKDEYQNPIVSWPTGLIHYDHSFEDATRQNEGRYGIDAKSGTVIENATGKPPAYVYGIPFPTVAPDDPQGGLKALWNQFNIYWNIGSYNFNALIVWVGTTSAERQSLQDVYFQYYENQAEKYRIKNPQGFLWQSVAASKTPADLQGTVALSYRFRDADKRDMVWTYVPALRRVRAVSPSNRSDGFLGSDLSQDDGNFFDAKVEDFKWKTIGMRDGFRFVDPMSIEGKGGKLIWVNSTMGGWRQDWPLNLPSAGFQKKDWKGIGWAPVSAALAKRKFWVVEGVPNDRYYLYGKVELWIDSESWVGSFNRKFSWKDEVLNTYQVDGYLNHPAPLADGSGYEWFWSSQHAWQCAESVKNQRATLAGLRSDMSLPFDRRVKLPVDQLFEVETLSRFGK